MPTAAHLSRRIANTEALLRRGVNGEYALELEQNLVVFRQMLAKVLALTAGVATCGHCEQEVAEGETMHAVCRATGE